MTDDRTTRRRDLRKSVAVVAFYVTALAAGCGREDPTIDAGSPDGGRRGTIPCANDQGPTRPSGTVTSSGTVAPSGSAPAHPGSTPARVCDRVGPPVGDSTGLTETTGGKSVAPSRHVTLFPGTDDGMPFGITSGPDGALWFSNANDDVIGRLTTAGESSHFDVTDYSVDLTSGPDGAIWVAVHLSPFISRISMTGELTAFAVPGDSTMRSIVPGPDGALWFTIGDSSTFSGAIGRITTDGTLTFFEDPSILTPFDITVGADGALWFTNQFSELSPDGKTRKGPGSIGRLTVDGSFSFFSVSDLSSPAGITAGPDGAIWFTNTNNHTIGQIDMAGTVTLYSDPRVVRANAIVAGPDGAMWFTNSDRSMPSIGRLSMSGEFEFITDPRVIQPQDIALGSDGALWFTDSEANQIGRIEP